MASSLPSGLNTTASHILLRAEVMLGKPDALRAFTAAMAEQLSAEHKRSLEGSTQAEAVLGRLDGQLLHRLPATGPDVPGPT
jgi:hypothetical protein